MNTPTSLWSDSRKTLWQARSFEENLYEYDRIVKIIEQYPLEITTKAGLYNAIKNAAWLLRNIEAKINSYHSTLLNILSFKDGHISELREALQRFSNPSSITNINDKVAFWQEQYYNVIRAYSQHKTQLMYYAQRFRETEQKLIDYQNHFAALTEENAKLKADVDRSNNMIEKLQKSLQS